MKSPLTLRALALIAPFLLAATAPAVANVRYVVTGIGGELQTNVLRHIDTVQFGPQVRHTARDLERVQERAIDNARLALRPFGYYSPTVTSRLRNGDPDEPIVEISVVPGPPIRISEAIVEVNGPGRADADLRGWLAEWPLRAGSILNQETWEARKREGLDIAATRGYLAAAFTNHAIEIDLEQNTAIIRLVMETGERYVMGDIDFGEHMLKSGILEYIPRFDKGDPYTARLVARLRTDLWKTGYFSDVNVFEVERPDLSPPAVDFRLNLKTENRNHYQGALGWGTDTDVRVQANWSRHPMSSSGGRLDLGVGWQQLDDELRIRATHRLPRRERVRQYWVTDATLRFENLDLEVKENPEDEGYIQIANGDINERHLRFGRMKLTNLASGEHQLFGTTFVQFINTDRSFRLRSDTGIVPTADVDPLLMSSVNALSVGFEWDLVAVEGKFFQTEGSRDRAWIFHSNTAFGSDVDFTQAYAGTRRSYLIGDRLKFHVRGEVGYTDADVREVNLDIGGTPLTVSLTDLPNFYRFKAGGSMSVRGYGFEQLSNNDIGSNNIVTASVEGEYRFLNNWSAAAFVDIGNAFNDWSDADLKRGIGVGLRWYSIAGEIRVDVAQAIDFDGKPWRLHISIGTPLL